MYRRQFISTGLMTAVVGTNLFVPFASAQDTTSTDENSVPKIVDMMMGNPDATVTVTEYASFTCPHCASFHETVMPQLKENYIDTGKIKFIYREVYFDRLGLWAGMLARCSGQDKYFGIADMLYKKQREWTSGANDAEVAENLYTLGRTAGLTDDAMKACMLDQEFAKALVAEFQKNAEADSINSTPSILVNGVNHSNQSYEDLKKLIDEQLEN